MIQRLIVVIFLVLAASHCIAQSDSTSSVPTRTIALTFDDVTKRDGPFFAGVERTRRLISSLSDAGVDEAMFFVTTGNVERSGPSGWQRVAAYTNAGHTLGNHSHAHKWLSRTATAEYIADLDVAVQKLHGLENLTPYYRFPFLDEGHSIEKRDELREALAARELRNGYVTVDTYDWYLDGLAKEAGAAGIDFEIEDLRDLYVDVIVSSTEFYDAMAQRILGRSPHHVLLLHENDLAAMFVGDLVAELERRGFRIISATDAFRDPIADSEPDSVFLGQGRIAAIAHEAGSSRDELVSPTEDETYLRRRFEKEVADLPSP